MAVLLPYGRTLPKQLAIGSGILTRLVSTARVARPQSQSSPSKQNSNGSRTSYLAFQTPRSYASAAGRPASKPKGHTGRTTAKRTTKKSTTKPKAPPKKKKAVKAKPKTKKVKKAPAASTLKKEASKKRTALKEKALLNQEPKKLPETAWTVQTATSPFVKGDSIASRSATLAAQFKQISPEEREALNRTANDNKAKNEVEYKRWVQTYTPIQIKDANNARQALLREAKANNVKRLAPFRNIKDDRAVKGLQTAYATFLADRWASGDFKGMTTVEAMRLIGREWKALSAGEKKPYFDKQDADRTRYISEYKTVYGIDPPVLSDKRRTP